MGFLRNRQLQKSKRRELREYSTIAERFLWHQVRNQTLGCTFRRQYGIGPYIVDFFCPEAQLVIEIDGESHLSEKARLYDQRRQSYLEALNFIVIRFVDDEVIEHLDRVLELIQYAVFHNRIRRALSQPPPGGGGEE